MDMQITTPEENVIVQLEPWQAVLQSTSGQVDTNWHRNLFEVAKRYGRISQDAVFKNYRLTTLENKFHTPGELAAAKDTAHMRVVDELNDAIAAALLYKMWDIYQKGEWITLKPRASTNDSAWTFGDYVANISSKSEEYHRKLAFVCERVFNWLLIHPIGDANGERITAEYMIRNFTILAMIQLSQAVFSKKPSDEEITKAIKAMVASDKPEEEAVRQGAALERIILGTDQEHYFVRELPGGACAYHIVVKDPKLIKRLDKFLEKYGERKMWASEQDNAL